MLRIFTIRRPEPDHDYFIYKRITPPKIKVNNAAGKEE